MWEVYLSQDVQDFFKKQDKHIVQRIKKGLQKLKTEDPFHYLEHFEGENYYKFRIGDYRVVFDVKGDLLTIHRVGDRKNVYK